MADWYVAKEGDNSDGLTVETAYNAIGTAVTAASASDTIYIGAGTFAEQVAVNKALTLIGSGRANTIITSASETDGTIKITSSNVKIQSLSSESSHATYGQGIRLVGGRSSIEIDDCYGYGAYDGLVLGDTGSSNYKITNSTFESTFDAIQLYKTTNILVENCIFNSTGTYNQVGATRGITSVSGCDDVVLRNVTMSAARTLNGDNYHLYGIECYGAFELYNVTLSANHTGTGEHQTYGILLSSGSILINNSKITTAAIAGTIYDIYITTGTVRSTNTTYDKTKVYGTVIDATDDMQLCSTGNRLFSQR